MANTIDCSRMSHLGCVDEPDASGASASKPTADKSVAERPPGVAALKDGEGRSLGHGSYECLNECVSSRGVAVLLSGATASLGCLMVPVACPIFIGASVGSLLGACEAACESQEPGR